jgi:hypothetical protein
MNSWTGFCLYVAGGVLIQDQKLDQSRPQTLNNLDFLVSAMKALGKRHAITNHFTTQLELDIDAAGVGKSSNHPSTNKVIPNIPINGLIAERQGRPMTMEDLCSFAEFSHGQVGGYADAQNGAETYHKLGVTPLTGILPASSRGVSPRDSPGTTVPPHLPHWNVSGKKPYLSQNVRQDSSIPPSFTGASATTSFTPTVNDVIDACSYSNFVQPSAPIAGNTPSSDSSTPNTMQYPYRQAESRSHEESTYNFDVDTSPFTTPSKWTPQDASVTFEKPAKRSHDFNSFLEDQMWGQDGGIG